MTRVNKISNEDYVLLQGQLLLFGSVVKDWNLEGFLQRIDHAEAIGPIIGPSLFIRAESNLRKIKRLAQALVPFVKEVREQAGVE